MSAIEKLKDKLKAYPEVKYEETAGEIRVCAANEKGFEVGIVCGDEDECLVSFEGWHEDFRKNQADDAIGCFLWGLTNKVRIKVTSRGGVDYHWTVQHFEEGKWQSCGVVGLLWFPFWRKKTVRYLQNDLIKAPAVKSGEDEQKR
jgi:hypothetical protein